MAQFNDFAPGHYIEKFNGEEKTLRKHRRAKFWVENKEGVLMATSKTWEAAVRTANKMDWIPRRK